MQRNKDVKHDEDSSLDVWIGLYKKVYPPFFENFFDFSKLDDKETSSKCKRYYIKLQEDSAQKKKHPNFKMAGDCIFNFNDKKVKIFEKYVSTDSGKQLLNYCAERHHSFENFAFMPITGGMNNQKGRHVFDRPDIHVNEILKYFRGDNSKIFSNARGNREALKWYLSLFENDIEFYIAKVYLIDDKEFIYKRFLSFSDVEISNEDTAIQYMKLAKEFWKKRNLN